MTSIFSSPSWAIDVWYFGALIFEVFNGQFQKIEQIKTKGEIPEVLYKYAQLINCFLYFIHSIYFFIAFLFVCLL